MSRHFGPALMSCLKQNEKYAFEGLVQLRSRGKKDRSFEFQSLARDLSIPWHQIYYAERMAEKSGSGDVNLLRWLIVHILYQSSSGHLRTDLTCLDENLSLWLTLDREVFPGTDREYEEQNGKIEEIKEDLAGCWREVVEENRQLFDSVESNSPFIYLPERQIVYIRKFYKMEKGLLGNLTELTEKNCAPPESVLEKVKIIAERLKERGVSGISESAVDITGKILGNRIAVLSGGPGTGKTTTLTALLRILRTLEQEEDSFSAGRIMLAAPTGRAANRMIESLRSAIQSCPLVGVDDELPHKAWTLHKLLGINPARRSVLYNKERPIPAELIILDEASMVDARMMSILFDALSPETSLLLVGDRDQLPSVDAGAVFGDFVSNAHRDGHKLGDKTLFLTKSWRSSSGILEAAEAVISGDSDGVLEILGSGRDDIKYRPLPQDDGLGELVDKIAAVYGIEKVRGIGDPENLFTVFENFAVLIPTRRGRFGVENINRLLKFRAAGQDRLFYHGQPVMVLSNDYELSLFNGDRGVIIERSGEFLAVFRDGSEEFRYIPAGKLGSFETSYCQTVHKSQGSEYESVLFIIPEGSERLLTREIVYTGLTRARRKLVLISSDELIRQSLSRVVVRHSGIREFLGGDNE